MSNGIRHPRRKINASTFLAILLAISVVGTAEFGNLQSAMAAFSGTNGKIAFASNGDGHWDIYVMNPDGSRQTNLTNDPAIDNEPSFSPDGTKIAFVRDGNIYVMNADGSGQSRLTVDGGNGPAWSPDGTKIAFSSQRENPGIYIMNADGTNQTGLTKNFAGEEHPAWSPDGTKIAFSKSSDGQIYIMNANGSGESKLTNSDAANSAPSWAPDGTRIAFSSARDGNYEIYVMNADGSNQTNLTKNSSSDVLPSFSPDGTKIAFVRNIESGGEIYVMNADGSNQTNRTNSNAADLDPDWGVLTTRKQLVINSTDLSGKSLKGMWTTIRESDGTLVRSGFTPLVFNAIQSTDYKVTVANYDGKVFSKWQDSGSISNSRTITLTSDTTLTAVYDTGSALRGFTNLFYEDTVHHRNLNISARTEGGEALHMWTIIDLISSDSSSTTYKVYATNGYQNLTFDQWADGDTNRVKTITIEGEGPSITGTTAYYRTG